MLGGGVMSTFDVIIVGGGPAGASSARILANSGLNVLLLEKANEYRYKPCAGGLSVKVLPYLPDGYGSVVERKLNRIVVHFDGQSMEFTYDKPVVYTVSRRTFDQFLRDKAQENGVNVHYNEMFLDVVMGGNIIEVVTNKSRYIGKYLVGADGYPSRVGNVFGIGSGYKTKIVALECEVPAIDKWMDAIHLFLFDGILGYGWIFPKKDTMAVGIGATVSSSRRELHQYLLRLFSTAGIRYVKPYGYIYPVGPNYRSRISRGGVILVGDAAGIADPFSGEGIYYALKGAQIVSSYIMSPFGSVESRFKKEIFNKQKRGKVLSFVFYKFFRHVFNQPMFEERGKNALRRFLEDGDFYYSVHFPWSRVLSMFLKGMKK